MDRLRNFNNTRIGEDCSALSGQHDNELFFECEFDNLNGLTLKDCVLDRSRFTTDSVRDALNFTLTLNCHSFNGVEYSPLLFDLMLSLLVMTKGNDEKREQIKQLLGDRYEALMKVLHRSE